MELYTERNNYNILFTFLKGLFELIEIIKTDRKYINYLSGDIKYIELFDSFDSLFFNLS